jgi:hypothetical protein
MPLALIETGHCNVDLKPSPIEPSWILECNPEARSHVLSSSACGTATTFAVRAVNKLKRMFFAPGGHRSSPQRDPTPFHDLMENSTRDAAPARFPWWRKTHNVN